MSQIINELATIEVSSEVLQQLDVDGIYQSFITNYRKLDNLKTFRSAYEKKSMLGRWWHNDTLRDAQLDSAEVQAEFSKTIGQLVLISILQSKKLYEQQTQLNEQQGKLKTQADGIAEHAGELQKQHQVLAKQSEKLETLVHEYFALKGLTEEGAQKLITIAREVKATKDGMLQEFAARSKDLEALCVDVTSQMTSLSAQVNDQIHQGLEQTQSAIVALQQETRKALAATESDLHDRQNAAQHTMGQYMAKLEQGQREAEASLLAKNAVLESTLSGVSTKLEHQEATYREKLGLIEGELERQAARASDVANELSKTKAELATSIHELKNHQNTLESFQREASRHIKRMGYVAAGLTVVVLGMLGGMAHLLRWI
jgi:archaellum component FlaC